MALTGELVLWGGAVGGRDPFMWVSPAEPKPSASPSPFGITSELTGPERKGGREAPWNVPISHEKHLWSRLQSKSYPTWQASLATLSSYKSLSEKMELETLM